MAKSPARKAPEKGVPVKVTRQAAPPLPPAMELPWERQIERFFDRLFDDFRFRRWPALSDFERRFPILAPAVHAPAVDVFEDKEAVVIKAELPGISRDDLEVTLGEHTLTIKGEKKKEEEVKKAEYYRWERSYGSFVRTVDIPAAVDVDHATAKFKDGVLEVRLPKTEAAKGKQIPVKGE